MFLFDEVFGRYIKQGNTAYWIESADRWLTVMYAAPAILQKQWAAFLCTPGDHVDDRNMGISSNIDLSALTDDLLRSFPKLFSDVENIPARKQNSVLMLAAFAAFTALEAEFIVRR